MSSKERKEPFRGCSTRARRPLIRHWSRGENLLHLLYLNLLKLNFQLWF